MQIINLISDTITLPTQAMLEAMMNAKLGDDVFNEDPTVIELEDKLANMFGKEAGLFCPSGTMANQIAIKVHTKPLDEVICDHYSHIYQYEVGGYAFHSGIAVNPLVGSYGKITAGQISDAIKPKFDWLPNSKLVVIENSTNKGGGNFYTCDELIPISDLCKKSMLNLHLDGARIFNVLVETNENPQDHGKLFDSLSICLSKGLGCPVGTVLLGDKAFISEARRIRKAMGGGMRQVGILAAAGIYALDHHIPQLKIDNDRAKEIGNILEKCIYVNRILPARTNILIFEINEDLTVDEVMLKLNNKGIKATAFGKQTIRFVFHRDISENMMNSLKNVLMKLF